MSLSLKHTYQVYHRQFVLIVKSTQERILMTKKILNTQKCEWCGKEFEPRRANMIYCNENCRSSHNQDKYLRLTKKIKRDTLSQYHKQKRLSFWTEELAKFWNKTKDKQ